MKTLAQLGALLRDRVHSAAITQDVLRRRAGVSRRTLTNVLSGKQDFKVTTLFAVADRLGLEVTLTPKSLVSDGELSTSTQLAEKSRAPSKT